MIVDDEWDAVIIGGGPAGATVARYAAEGGARVMVIDRRRAIGAPLQCGELVPTNAEMARLCPRVPELDDLLRTPSAAISRRTDELCLVPPSGRALAFEFGGQILDRVAHDRALEALARDAGAEFRLGTAVAAVDGHAVHLADGSVVRGRVVVGAGGPHDLLRRTRWRERSLHVAVSFVLMEGDFPDRVELHFGSVAPGGYGWMIPKQGGANIGLGVQPRFARGRPLRDYLAAFLSRYGGRITYRGGGLLPMSGAIRRFVKPPHLLVGDSAGMVFPSNGAGIVTAMVAGRIAGQVIAAHVRDETPLAEYERRWDAQVGREMRASQRAAWLGGLLFRLPDSLVNLAFSRLARPFAWRAITCRPLFGLF